MKRNLLEKNVVTPFIISIIGFVCFFLLEQQVIQYFPDDVVIIIKLVSVIVMFISLCLTFFGFIINLLQDIDKKMNNFHQNHDIIRDIGEKLLLLENNNILEISKENPELVQNYINWINERKNRSITLIKSKTLAALAPDYFDFVTMIYREAKNEIISTSAVNPKWYELAMRDGYIADQVKMIKNKKIKYTRIFFVEDKNDEISAQIKLDTFKVVKQQLENKFHITIVKTTSIINERDVAIVDDRFAIEAAIPVDEVTKLPKAEFKETYCYFYNSGKFSEIKRYIDGLKQKAIIELSPENYSVEKLAEIFLV